MSFIQLQKNRSKDGRQFTYVHLASSVWRGRKKTPKQERIYLGRLDESGREIIISKGFPSRFQESVPLEDIRSMLSEGKDVLAWLHAPSGGRQNDVADIPARVETIGDAHVLLELSRAAGLEELLSSSFGESDGLSLLSLAFQQVVDGRPLYLAGHWAEERSLPEKMKRGISVPEVYALMARTGSDIDGRESFFRDWLERLGRPECVICDTTSLSSYSDNLDLAEFGYNRDDEDLPQVNLSLVVDRSGTPVWYRTMQGSIPDVGTLKLNCQLLEDLGLKVFSTSLDRGFYSRANILEMLRAGIGFTIGVPFSVSQAKALVRRHRTALNSAKRSFQYMGRIMRHACDRWVVEDGKESYEIDAHVFFEPEVQAERMARFERIIFQIEEKAAKQSFGGRRDAFLWLSENASKLSGCFSVRTGDGGTVEIARKPRAVACASAHFGYTIVLTDKKKRSGADVLADYRSRDTAEKLFDSLKNEDGQHRLRTGIAVSAEGRLFLAFISLILRSSLEKRMREAGLLKGMTTAEFFAQMRKIKAVFTKSGKRFLLEISKKNRTLLTALKISLPS